MPLVIVLLVVLVCLVGGMVYFFVPDKFEITRALYPGILAVFLGVIVGARSGPGAPDVDVDADTRARFVDRSKRQQEVGSLFAQPFVWLAIVFTIVMTVAAFLI